MDALKATHLADSYGLLADGARERLEAMIREEQSFIDPNGSKPMALPRTGLFYYLLVVLHRSQWIKTHGLTADWFVLLFISSPSSIPINGSKPMALPRTGLFYYSLKLQNCENRFTRFLLLGFWMRLILSAYCLAFFFVLN